MEEMVLLIGIVAFILGLVALNKIAKLETRIAQLKLELGNLSAALTKAQVGGQTSATAAAPAEARPAEPEADQRTVVALDDRGVPIYSDATPEELAQASVPPAGLESTVPPPTAASAPPPEAAPKPAVARPDMEQALASRWFVWIGVLPSRWAAGCSSNTPMTKA